MAESYNTLAGLVQINDQNLADLEITDLLQDAPFLQVCAAVPASNGTQHKYLKQTTASSAAFRAALAGLTKTASADTLVTDTLKILDASFDTDVALAKGYRGGVDAWLQMELARSLRQSMAVTEAQIFQGVNNDAGGFVGLEDDGQLDALSDAMVVEPANAGASGSDQTSCYVLRVGPNDVAVVAGEDGKFIAAEEPSIIEKVVNPGTDNKVFPAYYVPVLGYLGFQIGGAYSAARIANIECATLTATDAFTDDDIYAALSLFPAGRQPTHVVMNRNALRLLRQSRTATNATGAPAPRPTEVEGTPIVVTDGITSTESAVS